MNLLRGNSRSRYRACPLVFCVLLTLCAPTAGIADAGTNCPFGGPTPSSDIVRLDLSQTGSSFLTLDLGGTRTQRVVNNDQNWHLGEGIFVVNASTFALEAYRLDSQGMAPRHAIASVNGTTIDQPISSPDVPYEHYAASLRDGLPPGVYYVIAFGVDGGAGSPNEQWSAAVTVSGTNVCTPVGDADVLDVNQTDFRGGTQLYAPGVGYGNGLTYSFQTQRQLIVGYIDAETQARSASSVSVSYQTPTSEGTLSQVLTPMISTAGQYQFSASYQGVYPLIGIAGVAASF
ncbi:MAG: hypothetical protein ACYDCC_10950 [Actinomycetota bacterium]